MDKQGFKAGSSDSAGSFHFIVLPLTDVGVLSYIVNPGSCHKEARAIFLMFSLFLSFTLYFNSMQKRLPEICDEDLSAATRPGVDSRRVFRKQDGDN